MKLLQSAALQLVSGGDAGDSYDEYETGDSYESDSYGGYGEGPVESFQTFDDGSTLTVYANGNVSSTNSTDNNYSYGASFSATGCVTLAAQAAATVFSRGGAAYANAAAGAASGCVTITRTR